MAYTTLAMAIRYFGKSYVGGALFLDQVIPNLRPSFGSKGAASVLNPNASILIGMLSTAYMAHFNAPKFYMELKDNTIARYNTVVGTSFGISIVIMALLTALGFLTFGSASSGLILNNYSTKDSLMSLSRVAVAFSIVFS
jgi:amino acid permease